ncbi:MAG: hypothetical protein HY056_13345, partial [Proteobacteria bacterium]|nr:hypothetical protein [Pseudomonadota bacterium]
GATKVSLGGYALGSAIGMLPRHAIYVAIGAAGNAAASDEFHFARVAVGAVALCAAIAAVAMIALRARARLRAMGIAARAPGHADAAGRSPPPSHR